jgi:glycolate oxidase FAD binding subunit
MDQATRELATALGARAPEAVRPAEERDAIAGVRPRLVVAPHDEESLAAVLAFADHEGLTVLPRGGGTQLGMGFPPTGGDIVLSLEHLDAVVEHAPADQTVTVQAGLTLAALQAALAPHGQRLALDPDRPDAATVGGILATNASGPRRLRYGGPRDLLIGIRVALPDGSLAKGGGKVVKNVAGYDLPKLYVGALGTLGVITAATFRLHPLPAAIRMVGLTSTDLPALGEAVVRVLTSSLTPALVDLTSPAVPGAPYRLDVAFESSVPAAVEAQAAALLALVDGLSIAPLPARSVREPDLSPQPSPLRGERGQGVRLKVSLVLAEVVPWLAGLERTAAEAGLRVAWCAHAGHGLVFASMAGPDDAVISAVEELRAAASAGQGSLVVLDASPELAACLDMWGPSPALVLMRRIKAQFDPHATLNPGRFLGRI